MSIFGIVVMRKARYMRDTTEAMAAGAALERIKQKYAADELDDYSKGYIDGLALAERPARPAPRPSAGRHLRLVRPDERAPAAS